MKLLSSLLVLAVCAVLAFFFGFHPKQDLLQPKEHRSLLVWADEFEVDGLPDPGKWGYDVGDGCDLPCGCGWGNGELQYYTHAQKENARIENGHLIITAQKGSPHEEAGKKRVLPTYTSARLVSKHKGDWKYGRIAVKAKLPRGRGTWPAIWMLPTENTYGGWPKSGEIDIMEHRGFTSDSIFGTIHTESYNGMTANQIGGSIYLPSAENQFHVYSIKWTENAIHWYVDDLLYFSYKKQQTDYKIWPFDQPFHLVMNLAVGGHWGDSTGEIDPDIWPQEMVVDYVRVYGLAEEGSGG